MTAAYQVAKHQAFPVAVTLMFLTAKYVVFALPVVYCFYPFGSSEIEGACICFPYSFLNSSCTRSTPIHNLFLLSSEASG
jgi:hypothetical protein